ncbi:hypothetical protein MARCHEWKA_01610 [Brevundimonas phage vB_BpoS-Marchewka]|uniref:Uncharacterized protein n=1 Tax=Brevundimonas phage vB_BpoS-Marchewka TaxID=2948604 RepID=A0A9E7N2I5_9CAUD|nr:hypothetical protein MARCHEWKA_01610 [Brevundimonas phage vB_BpoS-Marchewka]UTC29120.1 hypothetical protein BAMBUS_00370 [Brevundimonas phage vB_BpoS-Bambus]
MPLPQGAPWTAAMTLLTAAGLSARYEVADDGSTDDALVLTRDGQDLPVWVQCPNDDTPRGACFYGVSHQMGEGDATEFWMSGQTPTLLPAVHTALARVRDQNL